MSAYTWDDLQTKVYAGDGSLRDIYILNTTLREWESWIDHVNSNYKISFYNYESKITRGRIDSKTVLEFLNGSREGRHLNAATIHLGDIEIKTYFFSIDTIESDILPRDINSMDDHYNLMNYLCGLSLLFGKHVLLCPENERNAALITVDGNDVLLNKMIYPPIQLLNQNR